MLLGHSLSIEFRATLTFFDGLQILLILVLDAHSLSLLVFPGDIIALLLGMKLAHFIFPNPEFVSEHCRFPRCNLAFIGYVLLSLQKSGQGVRVLLPLDFQLLNLLLQRDLGSLSLSQLVLHVDKPLCATQGVYLLIQRGDLLLVAFDLLVNTAELVLFEFDLIFGVSLSLLIDALAHFHWRLTCSETVLTAHHFVLIVTSLVKRSLDGQIQFLQLSPQFLVNRKELLDFGLLDPILLRHNPVLLRGG